MTSRRERRERAMQPGWARVVATLGVASALAAATQARAALPEPQRALVERYVAALADGRYGDAYAALSTDERRYFGNVSNFESGFEADRLKIGAFTLVGSKSSAAGTVAVVSERVSFFDATRQTDVNATAKVTYGIVREGDGYAIKDPFHPWRVLVPENLASDASGVHLVVRKLSFYTGRLEMVVTFQNRSDGPVTFLPYGRTVLRDGDGRTYAPIASRVPGLTDRTLYTGLRLPSSGEYTGQMNFLTSDRFTPRALSLTLGPALAEGGDAPFALAFPTYALPSP